MDKVSNYVNFYIGDAVNVLKGIKSNSVNCVITSPPYYSLRDYGTGKWEGGDPDCNHIKKYARNDVGRSNVNGFHGSTTIKPQNNIQYYKEKCVKCGAVRIDKQIGNEDSPLSYINNLVDVFRQVYRVLTEDGVVFLNINDVYASKNFESIQRKSLMLIPFRLIIALQDCGWIVRQTLIWRATNKTPESVKDRFTNSHEYIFMLTKNAQYFFDCDQALEPANYDGRKKIVKDKLPDHKYASSKFRQRRAGDLSHKITTNRWQWIDGQPVRKIRSVWDIPIQSNNEAHYAVMPIRIAELCAKVGCPPNGVILDPFGGIATTAIAALNQNKNAIIIELNEYYVKLAREKVAKHVNQKYDECVFDMISI